MRDFEFPLSAIPNDLHHLIFEKMMYIDFTKFNACSNSSVQMCQYLLPQIKLQINAFRIDFTKCQVFLTKEMFLEGKSVSFEDIPINLGFNTPTVHVNIENHQNEATFHFFKRHLVKTIRILVDGTLTDDCLVFVQFILKKTTPEEWRYRTGTCVSEAFFYLAEVQKLRQIYYGVCLSITNDILLNLHISNVNLFSTGSSHAINANGIYFCLMQWIRKERRIKKLQLPRLETFDLESICAKIEESTSEVKIFRKMENPESQATKYWICRKEEKHDKCIWLEFEHGFLEIHACGTTEICPGLK